MGSDPGSLTPGSDDWWAKRLSNALMQRKPHIKDLFDIYGGEALVDISSTEGKEGFRNFLKMSNLNLASLIVDTMLPRMQPIAFKTASDDDENGDAEAYKLMKRCDLPVVFADIFQWAAVSGYAYGLVQKVDDKAWLTAEHPEQMIAEKNPITGLTTAAIKVYHDDQRELDIAVLFREGYSVTYTREAKYTTIPGSKHTETTSWAVDPEDWKRGPRVKTGTKSCPVIQLGTGVGEFEPFLNTLRRINHTILQRMVIVTLQAFKQRAVKGVPRKDPKTGEEIDYSQIFTTDPGAMWIIPEAAEIWESGQADLSPILNSIKDDVKNLAAESSTPLYSITPDAAQGSAEGAALQRETQIFKVEKRIMRSRGQLEHFIAMAFEVDGDTLRADREQLESVWADPSRSSLTERASSAALAAQAGVPWRYIMEKFIKLTPSEIAQAEKDRRREQMEAQALAGTTAPGAQPGNGRPAAGTGQSAQRPVASGAPRSAQQLSPRENPRGAVT